MNELKPLDIAHQFCRLLHYGNTGTREELARKLGISPVMLNTYRNKIEKLYGVTISYSRKSQTYYLPQSDYNKLPPPYLD